MAPKALKKADLNTKAGKYFLNKRKGMNKKEAALSAGYADGQHVTQIERSPTYQAIEKRYYKDTLLQKITLEKIAEEHMKVIEQDEDRGAKNTAIKMALERIEPETAMGSGEDQRILVILQD
jgi:hypothetical protein